MTASIIVAITRNPRPFIVLQSGSLPSVRRSVIDLAFEKVAAPRVTDQYIENLVTVIGPDGEMRVVVTQFPTQRQMEARGRRPVLHRNTKVA